MPHPAFANKKKGETCLRCEQEGRVCEAGHFQLELTGKFGHGSCQCGDGHKKSDHVPDTAGAGAAVGGNAAVGPSSPPVVFTNHAESAAAAMTPGGSETLEQRVRRVGLLLLSYSAGKNFSVKKTVRNMDKLRALAITSPAGTPLPVTSPMQNQSCPSSRRMKSK